MSTLHYPHDPFCEHRNCPECAVNVLRAMLADRQPPATTQQTVITTPGYIRRASRFRPMGA